MTQEERSRFQRRRQRLLNDLGEDGWLILPTAPEVLRNGDVHFDYRPDSSFFYLTGLAEPGALLAARRVSSRKHRSVLFVRERDPDSERWDGPRLGTRRAKRRVGVDECYPAASLYEKLEEMLSETETVFLTLGQRPELDSSLARIFERLKASDRRGARAYHPAIRDFSPILEEHRSIKDREELKALERAVAITRAGHLAAIRASRPGLHEYQIQSVLEAEFRARGSMRNGYPSIVASGKNACTLHYIENRRRVRDGDLVLIDAGAEWNLYTADVTRTFPVNGRFSDPQRQIYGAVLAAQEAAIAEARAGNDWLAPHRAAQRVLVRELTRLGILGSGSIAERRKLLRRYFMHGTSHWLGLDVHDVGAYERRSGRRKKPRVLEPGMVLTIEPGLYFDADDETVPSRFRGIGVRIEDDIAVTRGAPRNLSAGIPKSVEEIEALVGTAVR